MLIEAMSASGLRPLTSHECFWVMEAMSDSGLRPLTRRSKLSIVHKLRVPLVLEGTSAVRG